jgi:hypothetical protein
MLVVSGEVVVLGTVVGLGTVVVLGVGDGGGPSAAATPMPPPSAMAAAATVVITMRLIGFMLNLLLYSNGGPVSWTTWYPPFQAAPSSLCKG